MAILMACLFLADSIVLADLASYPQRNAPLRVRYWLRSTLAPSMRLTNTDFIERFKAKEFLLSHEAVNRYIKEQVEREIDILGDLKWKRDRTYNIDINSGMQTPEIGDDIVKVVAVTGLLKSTGQFAHVGLGARDYNSSVRSVIYIDKQFFGQSSPFYSSVLNHEIDEIVSWEKLRKDILHIASMSEMRKWIIIHIDSADERLAGSIYAGLNSRRIAKKFHDAAHPLGIMYSRYSEKVDFDYEYITTMLSLYGMDEGSQDVNIAAGATETARHTPEFIAITVASINHIGKTEISKLEDVQLFNKTDEFKKALMGGSTLDAILPKAFAVFKEAAYRVTKRHGSPMLISNEQVMAAIYAHSGNAVEMLPGEGKTLVIAMAAYLNALTGNGVHVHTFNDYLAKRDGQNMGHIFDFLGLSTGVIANNITYIYDRTAPNQELWIENLHEAYGRKNAYECDITYGVKDEFVFDYLRDNGIYELSQRRQRIRPPELVIVDEGDNTLLDEGCDPLILSRGNKGFDNPSVYKIIYEFSVKLKEGSEYTAHKREEYVEISKIGIEKILAYFTANKTLARLRLENDEKFYLVRRALKAHIFYECDVNYIVGNKNSLIVNRRAANGFRKKPKDFEDIIIVDPFTGRLKPIQVWEGYIHQFIEVKEGLPITKPAVTAGIDTYQYYYRRMRKSSRLTALSGTIGKDRAELKDIYGLDTVTVPLQFPCIREDMPVRDDFETEAAKTDFVINRVSEINKLGNPILVYASNIKAAKELSGKLQRAGVHNDVLDGRDIEEEPAIIAKAGLKGHVTVATKAAGRGIHIELGEGVSKIGGLAVVITYMNPSRRIDDQLKTRAGRRGLPGWTETYISKEDELFKRFGTERTQETSEAYYRQQRRAVLTFDEILDKHREEFYLLRRSCLELAPEKPVIPERLTIVDDLWSRHLAALEDLKLTTDFNEYRRIAEERFASVMSNARAIIGGTARAVVKIIVPDLMINIVGSKEIEVPFGTVREVINRLETEYPDIQRHVREAPNYLRKRGAIRIAWRINGKPSFNNLLVIGDTLELVLTSRVESIPAEDIVRAVEEESGVFLRVAARFHINRQVLSARIRRMQEGVEKVEPAMLERFNKVILPLLPYYTEETIAALEACNGDRKKAAAKLNIVLATLSKRMNKIRKAAAQEKNTAVTARLLRAVTLRTTPPAPPSPRPSIGLAKTLYIMDSLVPAKLTEGKVYEIRYDSARLREYQVRAGMDEGSSPEALLKAYVEQLQMRVHDGNPKEVIKLIESRTERGQQESLIAVTCYLDRSKSSFVGHGRVNIKGDLAGRQIDIAGILNIALAASNIPNNTSKTELHNYARIVDFIKSQYKAITGAELLSQDMLKAIRFIVLPPAAKLPADRIADYYRFAIRQLKEAA